jgi:L-asparagine transporter-like permease
MIKSKFKQWLVPLGTTLFTLFFTAITYILCEGNPQISHQATIVATLIIAFYTCVISWHILSSERRYK